MGIIEKKSTNSTSSPSPANDIVMLVEGSSLLQSAIPPILNITAVEKQLEDGEEKNEKLQISSAGARGKAVGGTQGEKGALVNGKNSKPNSNEKKKKERKEMKPPTPEQKEEMRKILEIQRQPDDFSLSMDSDARSVYVGNVDYKATKEVLEQHFHECGVIRRVTILSNKFTGHPKGCAYIEFGDKECVSTAMTLLDGSLFLGRLIKVSEKRTNQPGLNGMGGATRGSGSSAVFRGRGRGGGGFSGGYMRGAVHTPFFRRESPEITISGGIMRSYTKTSVRYSPYVLKK